jgi:hypothetical protein
VTPGSRRFRFVQLEFAWTLGPDPGRYSIREHLGEPPACILVLQTLGAPERRLLAGRRRARGTPAAAGPPPEPVPTSRATLVDTATLGDGDAAERWLRDAHLGELADAAVARLNRVLHAHRVAVADPHVHEVGREQALVVRVGYGDGQRVADGRWDRARELPSSGRSGGGSRSGHAAALYPQERLTALLAGRDVALACEELALRARSDLDAGRQREAALQLRLALEAALAELEPWRERPALAAGLAELRTRSADVFAAADAALRGGLDEQQIEIVTCALAGLEAALRARTAGGP